MVLTLAAAALAALAFLTFSEHRVYAAAVGISVLCGLFCGRAYALFHISPALELDGREMTVEGKVLSCKELGGDRFMLTVDGTADGRSVTVNFFASRACEPYSIVRISGKAEALEDTAAFPARSYYYPRGIYLQADADSVEETGEYASPIMRGVTSLRNYTAKCLFAGMDSESAAFAEALVCGDKSDMSARTKTKLCRAGVGHIFAMSGTHIAVIAMLAGMILSVFIPGIRLRLILLEAVILMFMAFGGFSPSIVRSGIMVSLTFCSRLFHRQTDVLSSLGICAVIMCGMNPYVCLSQSFICSFGACFAYGAAAPKLTAHLKGRRLSFVTIPLAATAVVTVVMMPVSALMFSEVTVIAPITNLLIVPLCTAALSLILLAMLFGGAVLPARIILSLANLLIKACMKLTDFFASLGAAAVGSGRLPLILVCSALIIAALVFAIVRGRPRVFALCTAGAFILMWAVQSIANLLVRDEVKLKLFSDGRSICAVVSDGGSCSMIDTGTKGKFTYGVQQYLSYSGIRRCGSVFVSEPLGASVYLTELYPEPDSIRTDLGYYSEPFTGGMTADLGGYTVTRTKEGYELSSGKDTVIITKKQALTAGGSTIFDGEEVYL